MRSRDFMRAVHTKHDSNNVHLLKLRALYMIFLSKFNW